MRPWQNTVLTCEAEAQPVRLPLGRGVEDRPSREGNGGGDGNRTRVLGLEDRFSTIEIHPRAQHEPSANPLTLMGMGISTKLGFASLLVASVWFAAAVLNPHLLAWVAASAFAAAGLLLIVVDGVSPAHGERL